MMEWINVIDWVAFDHFMRFRLAVLDFSYRYIIIDWALLGVLIVIGEVCDSFSLILHGSTAI